MSKKSWLTRTVYAVYSDAVGGITFDGKPMPKFEDLSGSPLKGWGAVAGYVGARMYETEVRETLADVLLLMWRNGERQKDVIVEVPPDDLELYREVLNNMGLENIRVSCEAGIDAGTFWVSVRRKIERVL